MSKRCVGQPIAGGGHVWLGLEPRWIHPPLSASWQMRLVTKWTGRCCTREAPPGADVANRVVGIRQNTLLAAG